MPPYMILSECHSVTLVYNTRLLLSRNIDSRTCDLESQASNGQQVKANNQVARARHEPSPDDKRKPTRAKLVTALVGGVMLLIVLPGIILGVLMKETMAGVALSSAITAVMELFAGLYYYLNKRD